MAKLLDYGLDIEFIISVCFKNSEQIISSLQNGKSLISSLCVPSNPYRIYLSTFSKYLSLKDSMTCAIELQSNSKGFMSDFIKQLAYPFFIFIFSFSLIQFFSNSIVPSIIQYSNSDSSIFFLSLLKCIFTVVFMGLCICGLICVCLYVYPPFCVWLIKTFHPKIVLQYISLQFVLMYVSLFKNGLSTHQCLEIIMKSESKLCSLVSSDIYSSLSSGISLLESISNCMFLDDELVKFFDMGMHTNMTSLLELYISRIKQLMRNWIKKVSFTMQIFSYSSVGLLAILVYQILLYPLNILNTL